MCKRILMTCFLIIAAVSNAYNWKPDAGYLKKETWRKIFSKERVVDYPVVFIHGIANNVKCWDKILTAMTDTYFTMRYFEKDTIYHNYCGEKPDRWFWSISYYTVNAAEESLRGDLNLYAARVKKMINLIRQITGKKKVVIIAHSMGGLIARSFMTLDKEAWDSVHRILTIASPHRGVATSIGIVGQTKDLMPGSRFLRQIDAGWDLKLKNGYRGWGVIGAVDTRLGYNWKDDPNAIDSAGVGFVAVSSAIPYGEWRDAVGKNMGIAVQNTPHFGFRLAVKGDHLGLLYHEGTMRGIRWALQRSISSNRE